MSVDLSLCQGKVIILEGIEYTEDYLSWASIF